MVRIAVVVVLLGASAGGLALWAMPLASALRRGQHVVTALTAAGVPWLALAPLAVAALIALRAAGRSGGRAAGPTTHGSARLADRRDLADLRLGRPRAPWRRMARPTDPAPGPALPAGALLLALDVGSRALHLPPALAERHVLLVAPSGAGKTRAVVLPNCAAIRAHSFVVTDPKGEAWRLTGGLHQRAVGFAPREPDASACFNFIPACADPATATLLAEAAMQAEEDRGEQLFWRQNTLVLCTALFAHAATTTIPTPATAYALLEAPDLLAILEVSPARQARRAAAALAGVDGKVRAAIVLDVQNRLSFLDDPAVRRMTSADTRGPDFGRLRAEPTALYWRLHERDMARLRPLSAVFWTLLLDRLVATDGLPVTLILDEFANVGAIPHFATTIAVARGRGLGVVIVAQSLGQLEAVYGRARAQTIRDCCSTRLTLGGGLDPATAQWFATLSGEATVVAESRSRRPSGRGWWGGDEETRTQQPVRRTLLTADEVRRLPPRTMLAVVADRPAMRLPTLWHDAPPCPGRAEPLGPELGLDFADEPAPAARAPRLRVVGPGDRPLAGGMDGAVDEGTGEGT